MLVRQCYVRNLDCLGFIVCSGRVVCSSVSSLKIVVPSKKSFDGAYSRGEKPLTKYGQRVHKSWWFVWVTLNHMIYKKCKRRLLKRLIDCFLISLLISLLTICSFCGTRGHRFNFSKKMSAEHSDTSGTRFTMSTN